MYHASVSKTFRHPIPQFSSDIRVREGVKLTMTQKKKKLETSSNEFLEWRCLSCVMFGFAVVVANIYNKVNNMIIGLK